MLKTANDPNGDKKKILYLLSFLIIAGYLLDIIFRDFLKTLFILNTSSIAVVTIALLLDHFSIIKNRRAYQVVIYTLLLNILLNNYLEFAIVTDVSILRSTIFIIALISVAAFLISKTHALIIGSILGVSILLTAFATNSSYLIDNIIILLLVIMGYSFGVYYIIFTVEEKTKSERLLVEEIQSNHNNSSFINSLAFELTELPSEIDIEPFVLERIKNHTNAKIAVFNVYDPNKKALIVKSIEASGPLLKLALSTLGEKIINTSSPVTQDVYYKMQSEQVGFSRSLTEVSFGSIPQSADKAFKTITGISSYFGIAHFFSGKLYGTTLLGFNSEQSFPKPEFLKSFAHLVAISLRRNIAEKSLIQSEAKLRSITANISDVVFTTDLSLNTTYISPSIVKLTGELPENYIFKKVGERFSHSSLKKIRSILTEELKAEKDPASDKKRTRIIELEMLKPNGKKIHVSSHISFIRDENYKATGILGVTRDITDIKRIQKQLERYTEKLKVLNADKDRFMQILAHDLKNPFNALMGLSDVLIANFESYENKKIKEIVGVINQTAKSTYALMEELLLWSNAHSGKLPFIPEMIDTSVVCKQVIEELDNLALKKKINIVLIAEQEYEAMADRMMFKTILRNLMSNAIKFSRKGETIKISFEKYDSNILVSVEDKGVGIRNEDLSKLWDISQLYTTEGTDNEKGTGLGLLLCKEFAEKHNGKIWVESEIDKGSTFKFTIPINVIPN